jgi:hypothetical protein
MTEWFPGMLMTNGTPCFSGSRRPSLGHTFTALTSMRILTLTFSASALLFFGCAGSAPSSKVAGTPGTFAAGASTSTVPLTKEMPAERVLALLGQPSEKKPMKTASGSGEIWIYRRNFQEQHGSAYEGTSMDVEFGPADPSGSRTRTVVPKTHYTPQYRRVDETTLILIIGDRVVEWDRTRSVGPTYTK